MRQMKAQGRRNVILTSVAAAMLALVATASEPAKLEVADNCTIRTFAAVASGSEKLEAGSGKLALLGSWRPSKLLVKGYRRIESAYVYDESHQNSFGGYSSERKAATPLLDLIEVTVEVDVSKDTRAVDISGLELQVAGSPPASILGFDTMRSAEVSDDFVKPDNGLCIVEGDGASPAKYLSILNTSAPRSTIVFLASCATRPLPVRMLFAIPAGTKAVTIVQRKQ